MNILLGNYSQSIPLINGNNRLKLNNKSFQNNFIPNKGNKSIKIRLSNTKNNDFNFNANSDREINNMKYYKKNNMKSFMNNFEIRQKLRNSNKYPEPEDIDDYLINMKDELQKSNKKEKIIYTIFRYINHNIQQKYTFSKVHKIFYFHIIFM